MTTDDDLFMPRDTAILITRTLERADRCVQLARDYRESYLLETWPDTAMQHLTNELAYLGVYLDKIRSHKSPTAGRLKPEFQEPAVRAPNTEPEITLTQRTDDSLFDHPRRPYPD